jgi:hypothetical protein
VSYSPTKSIKSSEVELLVRTPAISIRELNTPFSLRKAIKTAIFYADEVNRLACSVRIMAGVSHYLLILNKTFAPVNGIIPFWVGDTLNVVSPVTALRISSANALLQMRVITSSLPAEFFTLIGIVVVLIPIFA